MTQTIHHLKTSGDPLADRRYGYGVLLRGAGDLAAAADLFLQTLDLAPDWLAAWAALAEVRHELGETEAALAAWRQVLALDPADPLGVELKLALAGLAPAPQTPPEGYVRALFDDYAPGFETALVGHLGYCVPLAIRGAVAAARPGRRFARALDLGCGTGLTGEALRAAAVWLEGVDLSQGMIDLARAKRVFDALHVDEAQRFLGAQGRRFDLITAGDVAPYLGDIAALIAVAAQALEPQGVLVLTVELAPDSLSQGWLLQPSMRYAHSAAYVAARAGAAGLALVSRTDMTLRLDRGAPVHGTVLTFARPSTLRLPPGTVAPERCEDAPPTARILAG
jgi:predicted TPR repeat methyltransferase